MVEFSKVNIKDIEEDDDEDEEAGEEVESAPPLKVGEEREISSNGLKKKLINAGIDWETPQFGDEVTVHYVGSLLDGSMFVSTRASNEPVTFKLGHGDIVGGLDRGILTMRKREMAIFTLPPELAYGALGTTGVPPNSIVQFEVELLSWITVVDVCKDGGIIKKILENGEQIGPPGDLDEIRVTYKAILVDGTIVAEAPEEGIEFYVKDGHFCPALTKALKTMKLGERVNLVVQPQYGFGDMGKKSNNDLPIIPPDSVLSIFVKLLSFKQVIDITGDLKVKKKVLKEGEGTVTANEGAAVTIRYKAMSEDGTVFEKKGFDGEQPLQFITDEEQVIAGLDRAVSTMKKNERAIITISPEYGFESAEVKMGLSLVQPSSTILYEVEMLDFIREKAPWEMSTPERIEAAGRKKEEGNQLFKNGNYQRAAKKYEKAVDYVSQDGPYTDDDEKIVKSLRLSYWLNWAACCLKLNNFREVIDLCSKILDVESIGVAELLLAELDIKKALEADPQNREVKLMQRAIKKMQSCIEPCFHQKLQMLLLQQRYVGVDERENVQLFYYFVKSGSNPEKDPLVLWLTGGPGCSVLSGLIYEIGPISFEEVYDGGLPTLTLKPYAWTEVASILFLDLPVGTGFSYAKTPEASHSTGLQSCHQAAQFVQKWLANHPEFILNPFYVGGDSYTGMTVPVIVQMISDGNEMGIKPRINLKGYLLGNALTFPDEDNYKIPYAHGMGLISDELYKSLKRNCRGKYKNVDPSKVLCLQDLQSFHQLVDDVNEPHILEPNCPLYSPRPLKLSGERRFLEETHLELHNNKLISAQKCRTEKHKLASLWANDPSVQDALHVQKGSIRTWTRCNHSLPYTATSWDSTPYHANLSTKGYRSLIYNGDHDMVIPFLSTQAWIRSLNYPIIEEWRQWLVQGQIAGYTRTYANKMAFATVKGGGHTAPEYMPMQCAAMFSRWISNQSL